MDTTVCFSSETIRTSCAPYPQWSTAANLPSDVNATFTGKSPSGTCLPVGDNDQPFGKRICEFGCSPGIAVRAVLGTSAGFAGVGSCPWLIVLEDRISKKQKKNRQFMLVKKFICEYTGASNGGIRQNPFSPGILAYPSPFNSMFFGKRQVH